MLNIRTCVGKQCEGGKALTCQDAEGCKLPGLLHFHLSSLPGLSRWFRSRHFPAWAGNPPPCPEKRLLSGLPAFFRKTNGTLYNRAQEKRQLLTFLYIKIPPISINGMQERQCDVPYIYKRMDRYPGNFKTRPTL